MASSPFDIISTLLPSAAVDYIAIFTQDYKQIFREARPIRATVKEQAKVMEHPTEKGTIISDHRVILPVEIELLLILASANYQSVYKDIRQYYFNATLLIVQTRSGIYENQLIASLPHEENPEMFNALEISLNLKQIQFVTTQYGVVPRYPSDTTTVDRGVQQGTTIPTPTPSLVIFP